MSWTLVGSIYAFATVMSITPGPNNVMLMASGMAFGFRRTVPLMVGVIVGCIALILAVAAGVGAIVAALPQLHIAMKIAGSGYIVWLAWQIWSASGAKTVEAARPIGLVGGAMFQLVNPKAWIMALSAVSAFTQPGEAYLSSVILLTSLFFIASLPSITLWTGFGAMIRKLMERPEVLRRVNRCLAVATLLCVVLIWL